jgi:hypothetical protein
VIYEKGELIMVKEIGNTKIHSLCMVLHPMGARMNYLKTTSWFIR